MPSYNDAAPPRTQLSILYRSLLQSDELRFLVSDRRIAEIVAEEGISFGQDDDAVYTPAMVRTELWSCLLVYNLLRESMLHAARHSGRACRSLSLTATLQLFGNLWLSNAIRGVDPGLRELVFEHHLTIKVGHRPGRNEPRADKRRAKILQLLTKPRREAKAELESRA